MSGDFDEITTPGGITSLLDAQRRRLDEDVVNARDAHLVTIIKSVAIDTFKTHGLSSEEQQWVRLAIKREARRERFQQAVIEKSLSALVWAAMALVGVALWEFVIQHAWMSRKP